MFPNLLSKFSPIIIAIFIASTASSVLSWKICSWKYKSIYQDQYEALIKKINENTKKNIQISNAYQALLLKYNQLNEKANQDVKTEIQQNPVYSSCVLPANGVRILQSCALQANQVNTPLRIDAPL